MIDSNETIAYENGRNAGYAEGYEDAITGFVKYLKNHSFLCDPNDSFSFQAINVDDDLDELAESFLNLGMV